MQALSAVEGADPLDGGIPHQRGCEFPLGDDVSLLNLLETPNWLRGARAFPIFSRIVWRFRWSFPFLGLLAIVLVGLIRHTNCLAT